MPKPKPKRKQKKEKWFRPAEPTGWSKRDSAVKRRRTALASRHGDLLATAKALQALSNITTDKDTKRLSRADAIYFFGRYRKEKK